MKRYLKTVNYDWQTDQVVYTFNEDGEVKLGVVKNPTISFYVDTKDVERRGREMYVHKKEVEKITCEYKELTKVMAELSGNTSAYRTALKQRNMRALTMQLTQLPMFHGTDMDIDDYYISRIINSWMHKGVFNDMPKLHKVYSDIEVDLFNSSLDFDLHKDDDAPIDLASLYDEKSNVVYVYGLYGEDNADNKQIPEFIKNIRKNKEELMSEYKLSGVEFEWFDNDFDLIVAYFKKFHELKPDYLLFYNMMFDVPYMARRILYYGKSLEEVMCPKGFPITKVTIYEDEYSNSLAEKGDYIRITGFSNIACQMLTYAGFRATEEKLDDYKLETVGQKECGEGKVKLPVNIRKMSRYNYKLYVFYHVKDMVLQKDIESATGDIDLLHQIATITMTRPIKAWRKTISLRNLAVQFNRDKDYVISNNHNVNNIKNEKFPGAFVHDITRNLSVGLKMFGARLNTIFDNVEDFDMRSLYPSIILSHMIDPGNQYGRFTLKKQELLKQENGKVIFERVNKSMYLNKELGYKLADDLVSEDPFVLGRWLNLPEQDDVIESIL